MKQTSPELSTLAAETVAKLKRTKRWKPSRRVIYSLCMGLIGQDETPGQEG